MVKFSGTIYKTGINPVVDPPNDVLQAIFDKAGRSKGPIPVRGKLNGTEFIQTLVKYQGAWRLYINGEMLKSSGTKLGDAVEIEIEIDPRPREVPMPTAFSSALSKDKNATAAFDSLSPSRRKEILRYLGSLKSEESLIRNIERVIKHLKGEQADTLHALMRKNKD